jgi:hypothetical protein
MPEEPRSNVQFGQKIGMDDTSPPKVAHGARAAESRMVEDPYTGERARFVQPLKRRPPPEEASHASEYGEPEPGPPQGDVGLPEAAPSVWDASKAQDED